MILELIYLIAFVSSHSAQEANDGSNRVQRGSCVIPAQLEHGTYTTNIPKGRPGESYSYLVVNTTCHQNYKLEGLPTVPCYDGWWPEPIPKCVSTAPVEDNANSLKKCTFPSQPEHGTYITNLPSGQPGDLHDYIEVNTTCHKNHVLDGLESVYCYYGWWPQPLPKCVSTPQSGQVITSNDGANRPQGKCILPPYPKHGTYISNIPNGRPGDVSDYFNFNVTCRQSYTLDGPATIFCYNGWWPDKMPKCLSLPVALSTPGDNDRQQTDNSKTCILPAYPAHGTYTTTPDARPGDAVPVVAVSVSCEDGYVLNADSLVFCSSGHWPTQMPQCVVPCRLSPHPSVFYRCLSSVESIDGERFRDCREYEPAGTLAKPFCQDHYHSTTTLTYMECRDGEWSNVQKCVPECGTLTAKGTQLILNATIAKLGEVPWHTAIYKKTTEPYQLICGGSLISTNIVISAAHCFWDRFLGKQLPASDYLVAVGKLYRDFNITEQSQVSNVEAIRLPKRFREVTTNFQDDIAVVELSTPVQYQLHVRPVCVDFDAGFERRQLQPGNKGKVAGWGLISELGVESPELRTVDLPYVSIDTCFEKVPHTFTSLITSDKICAGYYNEGIALCKGDSGGGLAFLATDKDVKRYYLRGIASTAPTNDNACNGDTFTTFTRLRSHENFVTRYWRN